MRNFLEKHGDAAARAVKAAVASLGRVATADDIKQFCTVAAFLSDNEQLLSWRGKNKPTTNSEAHLTAKAIKFFRTRANTDYPSAPGTKPDRMVSIVLQVVYGYAPDQTAKIEIEHQHAMSSENIVGALLERYIANVMEAHGWVWCAGDFVKAVDFVKWNGKGWSALQIKNRDNTENSSSSAIRNGTDIEKWFRGYSKTGETNWAAFPDEKSKDSLTEAGFTSYVKQYLAAAKKKD